MEPRTDPYFSPGRVDTNCTNEHKCGGTEVNEGLLGWRAGEGGGSDYKEDVGGVAAHIDIRISKGLGEGGYGVGGQVGGFGQYLRPDSGRGHLAGDRGGDGQE